MGKVLQNVARWAGRSVYRDSLARVRDSWTSLQLHTNRLIKRGDPIIVYAAGKTGTCTVQTSLVSLGLTSPLYHLHRISAEGVKVAEERFRRLNHAGFPLVEEGRFLQREIKKQRGRRWKIITLVRDPIAINVSAFFETMELWYADLPARYSRGEISLADLAGKFFSDYFHDDALTWFDSELKQVFGVDVLSSSFPHSKGYRTYQGETADVLLIRLENLDACAREAFKEFLNIDNFVVRGENFSTDKSYRDVYRAFTKSIEFPETYLTRMYESRFAKTFYSEEEIASFKSKWKKRDGAK